MADGLAEILGDDEFEDDFGDDPFAVPKPDEPLPPEPDKAPATAAAVPAADPAGVKAGVAKDEDPQRPRENNAQDVGRPNAAVGDAPTTGAPAASDRGARSPTLMPSCPVLRSCPVLHRVKVNRSGTLHTLSYQKFVSPP